MNCADVQKLLPILLYGDLDPREQTEAQKHLDGCPVCQRVHADLAEVRGLLDREATPKVQVDVGRIYQEAARLQDRRIRRWRYTAAACAAVAAGLLLAFGLKWELRLEGHQVVVRWGAAPAPAPVADVPPPQPPVAAAEPPPAVTAEELRLLADLVHALAADADDRDRRRQQELTRLAEQLDDLSAMTRDRWAAVNRDVAALYADRFTLRKEGDSP